MQDVTVSIVNYNSRADLIGCLESLGEAHTAFVIDNASPESIRDLEDKYKWAHFIFNEKNVGFGAANNIALKKANTRYFLICNPDIRFGKKTVETLIEYMDANPDVAIAGPKLVNEDGTVQYSCRRFPTPATFFARGFFPGKSPKFMRDYLMTDADRSRPLDVDWVLGSFMFTRREALAKLGGFDESHFMYYEDIDLCYRAKKSGMRVVYLPQAEAVHRYKRESAQGLFNKLKFHHTVNAMRFFARRMFS
ncbi:MAG TPA: glycosyltransferase family 2 protein [Candidatus Omnitrophota bacterium]|nr:glycosyltransferase family 2 protein [Candidatus Omnitrophota bacterium]